MTGPVWRIAVAALGGALFIILWAQLVGGGLVAGRIDPAFHIVPAILAMTVLAILARPWSSREARLAAAAMLVLVAVINIVAGAWLGSRIAWEQILATMAVQALAWFAIAAIVQRRKGRSGYIVAALAGTALAALASWVTSSAYQPRLPAEPARLGIVAGVPIEWEGTPDMTTILSGNAVPSPILPSLEKRYRVTRIDDLTPAALAAVDVLLLAHPPALAPVDLVAIDEWVRAGGRAVILADGLSSWPPPLPLGDPRNPPVTSLLTAMLDHWGLDLIAPKDPVEEVFMAGGIRVHAASVGRFTTTGNSCTLSLDRRVARCSFGARGGEAILVGDADFLFPALWAGGGNTPRDWRSGNIEWLANMIDSQSGIATHGLFQPVWRNPSPGGEMSQRYRTDGH